MAVGGTAVLQAVHCFGPDRCQTFLSSEVTRSHPSVSLMRSPGTVPFRRAISSTRAFPPLLAGAPG